MASPQKGSYPLRLGNSLKSRDHRSSLSLKFQRIPDTTFLDLGGVFRREKNSNRCQVHLPTKGGRIRKFSGIRPSRVNQKLRDYVLVFVDGVFYLERNLDTYSGLRPVESRSGALQPNQSEEDCEEDPDSWMVAEGSTTTPAPPARVVVDQESVGLKTVAAKGMKTVSYVYNDLTQVEGAHNRCHYDDESKSRGGKDSSSDSDSSSYDTCSSSSDDDSSGSSRDFSGSSGDSSESGTDSSSE